MIHSVDDVGRGLAEKVQLDHRLSIDQSGVDDIQLAVDDGGYVGQADRRLIVIGDDQPAIIVGAEKLIIGIQENAAIRIRDGTFRQMGIGAINRRADLIEADTQLAQQQRVDFGADGRLRTASHLDLADALDLLEFLSQDRIGHVEHGLLGNGVRSKREDHDGRLGGIGLAPTRIGGHVGGQLAAGCVDGRLNVAAGGVDIAIQIKLQDDLSSAEPAERGHLIDAGNAAKHTFEGRGDGGGHGFRVGAGQVCLD